MEHGLRLRAEEETDLPPVSAMVQDATVKVGDIAWLPGRHRFVLMLNRYRWENAGADSNSPGERIRSALRFESVLKAGFRNVPQSDPDHVMELLALRFSPENDGTGTVDLEFAGFATIRLEVECLDIFLEDVTSPWKAKRRPDHNLGEDEGDT